MSHSLCTLRYNSMQLQPQHPQPWILCAKTTTKYYYFCVCVLFFCCVLCCVAIAYTILLLHVHDDRIKAIAINESHTSAWTARWRRHYSDPLNWWTAPRPIQMHFICHSRRTFARAPIQSHRSKNVVHFVIVHSQSSIDSVDFIQPTEMITQLATTYPYSSTVRHIIKYNFESFFFVFGRKENSVYSPF